MQQYCERRPTYAGNGGGTDKPAPVAALLRSTTATGNYHTNPYITFTAQSDRNDGPNEQHRKSRTAAVSDNGLHHNHQHHHHHHHYNDDADNDASNAYYTSDGRCRVHLSHDPHHNADVASAPPPPPIMNRSEYKQRLAVAEALARSSMLVSPAARRRLAARRIQMNLTSAASEADDGYWDEDFDYVPPKGLLMYMVR